jgi:hypothetical protein
MTVGSWLSASVAIEVRDKNNTPLLKARNDHRT